MSADYLRETAAEHSAENDARQWAVRAENGVTCRASEEIARAAVTEGGYTLGSDRSPIVAALTRATPDDEWTRVIPPGTDALTERGEQP